MDVFQRDARNVFREFARYDFDRNNHSKLEENRIISRGLRYLSNYDLFKIKTVNIRMTHHCYVFHIEMNK